MQKALMMICWPRSKHVVVAVRLMSAWPANVINHLRIADTTDTTDGGGGGGGGACVRAPVRASVRLYMCACVRACVCACNGRTVFCEAPTTCVRTTTTPSVEKLWLNLQPLALLHRASVCLPT